MTTSTFYVESGGDDQEVYKGFTPAVYPPTGAVIRNLGADYLTTARTRSLAGSGLISNSLISFNTGPILPDNAIVDSATLYLTHGDLTISEDGRSFRIERYDWTGSSDSDYSESGEAGTTTATKAISSIATNAINVYSIPVSQISKTGYTSFRTHITGGTPSAGGENRVTIYSYENAGANGFASPRLVVNWHLPTSPPPPPASSSNSLTFTVPNSSDDDYVYKRSGAWPPTGLVTRNPTSTAVFATAGKYNNNPGYEVEVGLIRFNTAGIPDAATITGALFIPDVYTYTAAMDYLVKGEYYAWNGTDSDWTATPSSTAFSIRGGWDMSVYPIRLSNLGSINKTGYTSFRIHVDNPSPTTQNRIWGMISKDYFAGGSTSFSEPLLIVYYDGELVPPTVRTVSSATDNSNPFITISKPMDTVAGDVMIATIVLYGSAGVIAPPSGWTLIRASSHPAGTLGVASYYKVAGGSEPTTYTWTHGIAGISCGGGIGSYVGVDNTNPIDNSAVGDYGSDTTLYAPSVNASVRNTNALRIFAAYRPNVAIGGLNAPTGRPRIRVTAQDVNNSYRELLFQMDGIQGASGPTGSTYVTSSDPVDYATQTVVLRPAGSLPSSPPQPVTSPYPFRMTSGSQDQYVEKSGSSYPPSGAVLRNTSGLLVWTDRDLASNGIYYVDNGLFVFDTSGLPDSQTINAAQFEGVCAYRSNADGLFLAFEWYQWDGTDSDWTNFPLGTANAGVPLSEIGPGVNNVFPLTNLGSISKTGSTYLRLFITQRVGDAAPTGDNYVAFWAQEQGAGNSALLRVTFGQSGASKAIVGTVGT